MRAFRGLLLAASVWPAIVHAASDKPVMAPPADWVRPVALPALSGKSDEAPIRLILSDQQIRFERGKETVYTDLALRIQTPQGLAAGNLSLPWNPETNVLTIHKLVIHRGGTDIDVLGSGQTFTVVRREPNLENATLDGMLTANIQPEGLQVGDVLEFAVSMTTSDPVLQGHVEQFGGDWNGLPIDHAHIRASWPSSLPVVLRQTDNLPPIKPVKAAGMTSVELSLEGVEPMIPPRGAPARFSAGRIIEFSDFTSWADLGALMAPLYDKAAVVPAQGPLRDEVEKIKAASADPVERAQGALALVQDRVRYVALLMGAGGYVPADASETWGRRYGDCKAKTALLLALLHDMGIDAEPVAANAIMGDGLDARLPMVGVFNHVLVRAHIAGKDYWLDGTRTGDTSLARLRFPDFGWGLPLVAKNAALVRMVPPPLDVPERDYAIEIDARNGLSLPAATKASIVLRGDQALGFKLALAQLTEDQRTKALRDYWKNQLSDLTVGKAAAHYDPATGEETLTVEGTSQMDWSSSWYSPDRIGQGYDADFSRDAGPGAAAPFANGYPDYVSTKITIKLPPGFPDDPDFSVASVDETIGATHYFRKAALKDSIFTVEAATRELAPEFPAADAPAAEKAFHALANKRVSLRKPAAVWMTSGEIDLVLKETPKTVEALKYRGELLLVHSRFKDAIVDFDAVIKLEPRNASVLASRGYSHAMRGESDLASVDLDAAEAIDPSIDTIYSARANVAMRRDDPAGAIVAYDKVLSINPRNWFALEQRANLNLAQGQFVAAANDSDAALKMEPKRFNLRALRARALIALDRRDEARAEALSLEEASPADATSLMTAANIYRDLGDTDAASRVIDRRLELNSDAMAFYVRAIFRPLEDFSGREGDLRAALKLDPESWFMIPVLAKVQIDKGDFDGAIRTYTDLLEKRPNNSDILNLRGVAHLKAKELKLAQADFEDARQEATTADLLNGLCYGKAIAGMALDRALDECNAALDKEPERAAILDSKAFVMLRLGRLDEALALYDRVLTKSPHLVASLFGRGIAWSRKGDPAKAQADITAARRLNPLVDDEFKGYGITP